MNRIDELISEHCPGGVPRVPMASLVSKVSKVKWSEVGDISFQYIDLASVDVTLHEIVSTTTIDSKTAPSRAQQLVQKDDVLFGSTRPLQMRFCLITSDFDGQICSTGYVVLRPNVDKLHPDFLKHVVSSQDFYDHVSAFQKGASYPSISDADVNRYEMPLPSMEVQLEIVRILDAMTSLQAELQAELAARQKQYGFYRNSLLTFDVPGAPPVRWMKLGEIFDMRNGYTPSKSISEFWTDGEIPWIRLEDIRLNGRRLSSSEQVVSRSAVKSGTVFPAESLLMSTSATVGEHAWVSVPHLSNQRFVSLHVKKEFEDQINPAFIFHVGFLIGEWCRENTNSSSFASISNVKLAKYEFPIPSLLEQQRIVEFLDKFDELTAGITTGLPAEIAARRKQYEYYRDKLLTFDELAA